MSSNSLIVQDYLSSLKEDSELDHIFPLLLQSLKFRIVQTAKEAKGQSQYGKDIVAIGKDDSGKRYRWYFELKGYADRDITDKNYYTSDGIRESIIEAKDAAFNDLSIPGFNQLPVKIVVVHNGILKPNIRPTFEGFIQKEFKDGEFERWDIYQLTDLFSKYLFSEYLLSDNESNRLLKKTLAFLDTPDYNYEEFKKLVIIQFEKINSVKGRALAKLFATLGILQTLVFHYSKENNNIIPAKECSKFLILYTWSWVLKNNLENKTSIVTEFRKLLKIQFGIFNDYFRKTFPIAKLPDGLFSERGAFFESIGYPLRCFDYLDDIIYYSRLRLIFSKKEKHNRFIINKQKDLLIELIGNNSGFYRPILDNHSIPIVQLFLFFADEKTRRQQDVNFITEVVFGVLGSIIDEKRKYDRIPELYNNMEKVIEFFVLNQKPDGYEDSSSVLLAIIAELLVIFKAKGSFEIFHKYLSENLNLQIATIDSSEYDVEQLLFEKNLHEEYFVDSIQELTTDFEEFKKERYSKVLPMLEFRTDKVGLSCIRYLAHSYYKNEILPEEWRQYFI
ncbi:hypothetical protein [Elizabethkingia ursingii]|uniref:Restriction endonuclease n=1 Tax=Elizabethkingia ursingii TaxID=1756150 RepID=A0ABX3N7C0_9FLAO|nr:hypothetical protein [Elizabethkingia ursingii]OPB84420.1 hypothetical protein BB021_16900 [Elizabethkingia ursingii]